MNYLKKIKSGFILILKKKIILNSKYYKVRIKCSDESIFKALGLSTIETDMLNILKPTLKGKNKISFRKEWVKYFYLNFNEINSINELVSAYNNLIKSLSKDKIIEEIFSLNDNYLHILPIKIEDIQFNFKILSSFCKMSKNQIKLNGDGYAEVLSPNKFIIKKRIYPKLIKIFSPNVLPSFTQSNNYGGLIGVFPYKKEEDYNHEILNNFHIQLYKGIHSDIKFVLCNEKNEKINFSSGTSTLLHCQFHNNNTMGSNKILYFNSADKKSLNLFPDNSQSNFSQIIDGELNCSDGNHIVALQSIFIPHNIHNLPSSNFNFSVLSYTHFYSPSNQINKSDYSLENFPSKYYDERIFFEEMRKKCKKFGCDFSQKNERYILNLKKNSQYSEIHFSFPPQIAYILGITNTVLDKDSKIILYKLDDKNLNEVSFTFKNRFNLIRTKIIKLCCNFVENSYFGSEMTQLLHTINLDENYYNMKDTGIFIDMHEKIFLKVNKNNYNYIRFQLLDQNNNFVKFESLDSVEGVVVFSSE